MLCHDLCSSSGNRCDNAFKVLKKNKPGGGGTDINLSSS